MSAIQTLLDEQRRVTRLTASRRAGHNIDSDLVADARWAYLGGFLRGRCGVLSVDAEDGPFVETRIADFDRARVPLDRPLAVVLDNLTLSISVTQGARQVAARIGTLLFAPTGYTPPNDDYAELVNEIEGENEHRVWMTAIPLPEHGDVRHVLGNRFVFGDVLRRTPEDELMPFPEAMEVLGLIRRLNH